MTGNMLTFSLVKKIGEGTYLNKDLFILERVRRERSLNFPRIKIDSDKRKTRPSTRNG